MSPVVFLFIYKASGELGVVEVKTYLIYQASFQQFVRKSNKTSGKTVKCLCVCYLVNCSAKSGDLRISLSGYLSCCVSLSRV